MAHPRVLHSLPSFSISSKCAMCVGRFGVDPRWSETGDRYLLKLFRDYVFHQVYDDGNPAVDLGHVVDTLNKVRLSL